MGMLVPTQIFGQKDKVKRDFSLRQQVGQVITNSTKNIKKEKRNDAKIDIIQKMILEIHELRKKNARQMDSDEIYFDSLLGALDELPKTADELKLKKCNDFESPIRIKWSPENPQGTTDPGAKVALDLLYKVCK